VIYQPASHTDGACWCVESCNRQVNRRLAVTLVIACGDTQTAATAADKKARPYCPTRRRFPLAPLQTPNPSCAEPHKPWAIAPPPLPQQRPKKLGPECPECPCSCSCQGHSHANARICKPCTFHRGPAPQASAAQSSAKCCSVSSQQNREPAAPVEAGILAPLTPATCHLLVPSRESQRGSQIFIKATTTKTSAAELTLPSPPLPCPASDP
jgi:hypothetical protein